MTGGWEGAPLPPGLPPGHVPADQGLGGAPGLVPWEDPSAGSDVERLWSTIRDVFTAPGQLFDRVPSSEALGRPILFGMIVSVVAQAAMAAQDLIFGSSVDAIAKLLGAHGSSASSPLSGVAGRIGVAVFGVVLYPIGLLLGGAISHGCLALFGAANRPMTITIRTLAYSSAASLVAIVPFFGPAVASIVHIVLEIIGLSHAHRAPIGRVTAAVLLPVVVACACAIAVIAAMFGLIMKMVGTL